MSCLGRRARGLLVAATATLIVAMAVTCIAFVGGRGGGHSELEGVSRGRKAATTGLHVKFRKWSDGELGIPSMGQAWKDLRLASQEVKTWVERAREKRSHLPFVPPPGERVPKEDWKVTWEELGCPNVKPAYEVRALGCNRPGGCGARRPLIPTDHIEQCGDRTAKCVLSLKECIRETTPSTRGPTDPAVCLCHERLRDEGCGKGCADALFYDYGVVTQECWHWNIWQGCRYIDRFRFKDEQLFDHADGAGLDRAGPYYENWPKNWEDEDGAEEDDMQQEKGLKGEGQSGKADEGEGKDGGKDEVKGQEDGNEAKGGR